MLSSLGLVLAGWPGVVSAQPGRDWGDQIWEGTAEVSIPRLIWKTERPSGSRIETAAGVKIFVPVQVWFWAKTNSPTNGMMVCLNSRKLGNDPLRTELVGVLGQLTAWGDDLIRRKPSGIDFSLELGDEPAVGRYELSKNGASATFQTINIDSGTGYFNPRPRRVIHWVGSFRRKGNQLHGAAALAAPVFSWNWWDTTSGRDETICSLRGPVKVVLPKAVLTGQKPSAEEASRLARFRDARDLYP